MKVSIERILQIALETHTGLTFEIEKCESIVDSLRDLEFDLNAKKSIKRLDTHHLTYLS